MRPEPGKLRWVPWLPVVTVAYWVMLAVATHWPRLEPALPPPYQEDKLEHLLGYAVLAALLGLTFHVGTLWRRGVAKPRLGRLLLVLLIVAVYGVVDELTQPWFGRNCELADWLSDLAGAGIGLVAAWCVLRHTARSAPLPAGSSTGR